MKLIKIEGNHFIIVSDEKINLNEWYYRENKIEELILQCKVITGGKNEFINGFCKSNCYKITHSTQPLEGVLPLNLSEVKELIGGIDVEKLSVEHMEHNVKVGRTLNIARIQSESYCLGLLKMQELNKEKKYTDEDIIKAVSLGADWAFDMSDEDKNIEDVSNEFITSLQPPTEWNITIEDNKLKLL